MSQRIMFGEVPGMANSFFMVTSGRRRCELPSVAEWSGRRAGVQVDCNAAAVRSSRPGGIRRIPQIAGDAFDLVVPTADGRVQPADVHAQPADVHGQTTDVHGQTPTLIAGLRPQPLMPQWITPPQPRFGVIFNHHPDHPPKGGSPTRGWICCFPEKLDDGLLRSSQRLVNYTKICTLLSQVCAGLCANDLALATTRSEEEGHRLASLG